MSLELLTCQINHQEVLRAQKADKLIFALNFSASRVQNLLVRLLVKLHVQLLFDVLLHE